MSDGEVTSPLIVWNNRLIDGHHRRQIILKHPELSFHIKEIGFVDKYEAIAWICRNQAGRRNLTPEQFLVLRSAHPDHLLPRSRHLLPAVHLRAESPHR